MSEKLAAGTPIPEIDLPRVGGGTLHVGGPRSGYQLVVVYRGRHCPLCKRYLARLQELLGELAELEVDVLAMSADPQEKAAADVSEHGWTFPVGHGLSLAQMRALGLYISEPRSAKETDRPFAEPALFVVNPEGLVQVVDLSNAPWVRPDLGGVVHGIRRIREVGYPIRGTLA